LSWLLIILSLAITLFIFLCFFNAKDVKAKAFIKRIEHYAENFSDRRKIKRSSEIDLFLKEKGLLQILGIRVKTTTGVFVFRIILSITGFIIFIILGFFFGNNFYIIAFILALTLYFLPIEVLKSKIKAISKKISNELPESLDILSSLIKAGLNLDQAIDYYSINYRGEISNLFKIAKTKIYEGKSPRESYFEIAELSFCNEFKSALKIIVQSDMVGNPINKVLKDLSRAIRRDQRDQIKIKAERLESSLMLVIFVFMFIPMMILFLLPVIPQLKMIFN
jgi:Flp pilus assembly protein TadB